MTSPVDTIKSICGESVVSQFRDQTRVVVSREKLLAVMTALKERHGFDMLVDVTCVDYLHAREAVARFGMVYLLGSTETNDRLTVRVFFEEDDEDDLVVASMVPLWEAANWLEREAWDLFGIRFEGHPDLRRILLPEAFASHPLRKDYPLQGRGERHNLPRITRAEG